MAKSNARKVVLSEEPEPAGLAELLNQSAPAPHAAEDPARPLAGPPGRKKGPDDGDEEGPDEADRPRRQSDPPAEYEDLPERRREPGDEDEKAALARHRSIDADLAGGDWPDGGGPVLDGEVIPSSRNPHPAHRPGQQLEVGPLRYESRIRVLEAFQYKGSLLEAPDWVDRNWMAHADFDPLRNIEAGPALRVPSLKGDYSIVRPGDYVVRQEVVLAAGLDPDVQLECWPQESFERLFIPSV